MFVHLPPVLFLLALCPRSTSGPSSPRRSSPAPKMVLRPLNNKLTPNISTKGTIVSVGRRGPKKPSLAIYNYGDSGFVSGTNNETETEGGGDGYNQRGQMLAGLPDLSDPCFRRYANSIIVNAQPFERRSSITLLNCKFQCLGAQLGLYSCRSFVYDNLNQVCDLFAHVGDQSPAKLLRFKSRDYFEPTSAIHCAIADTSIGAAPAMGVPIGTTPPILTTTATLTATMMTTSRSTPPSPSSPPPPSNSALSLLSPTTSSPPPSNTVPSPPSFGPNDIGALIQDEEDDKQGRTTVEEGLKREREGCTELQVSRFLRTVDFELFGFDKVRSGDAHGADECARTCTTDTQRAVDGSGSPKCNSFEFTANRAECTFSTEIAVPLGNGQLRQRPGTDYFERICVDRQLASQCQPAPASPGFRRFPQMILVGFAETVVDSASLQQCFDNCLNSRQLFGFVCSSGLFYFEEPQLNCILNTEDRNSQPELFTTETSDLVDYFETGCKERQNREGGMDGGTKAAAPAEGGAKTEGVNTSRRRDFVGRMHQSRNHSKHRDFRGSNTVKNTIRWSEWSKCIAGMDQRWRTTMGTQMRRKLCVGGRICGKEQRQCIMGERREEARRKGGWKGSGFVHRS